MDFLKPFYYSKVFHILVPANHIIMFLGYNSNLLFSYIFFYFFTRTDFIKFLILNANLRRDKPFYLEYFFKSLKLNLKNNDN